MKTATLPKNLTLVRSDKTNSRHEYHWFVCPQSDQMPVFSPENTGDASLKACLTWLENQGYACQGDTPPECFDYCR